MSNAFEYGGALLPQETDPDTGERIPAQIDNNQPYLNLATYVFCMCPPNDPLMTTGRFRMVVLADDILESFFETDLAASFRLETVPELEVPTHNSGFLGDLWSNIATADST